MRKSVSFLLLLASALCLPAAPSLTTIQDILYKADGTRFNGTLSIQWNNFQAGDTSIVATQQITLQIVNGVLKVQLVPTTNASPGANYSINYASAGRFQFNETWAIPPSSTALKVRDVRVSTGTTVGAQPVSGGQIGISDVQGLTNELLVRPIRGAGFAPARVAFINAAGQIEAVQGNLGDCITVDGSSVPCGGSDGSTSATAFGETPSGNVNGSNATFTLAFQPAPGSSLQLYRNGLLMGANIDFVLTSNQITFLTPSVPQTGDTLIATYLYTPPGNIAGNQTASNAPEVLCTGMGGTTASTSLAILGTCNIAANKLVAGDRVEIKFGLTHQGTAAGFNPALYWGSAGLVLRGMNASDTAIVGEAVVTVASDGTFAHFTTQQRIGGLAADYLRHRCRQRAQPQHNCLRRVAGPHRHGGFHHVAVLLDYALPGASVRGSKRAAGPKEKSRGPYVNRLVVTIPQLVEDGLI